MGDYVTLYEGGFSYLTVRGSGHMVPEFKGAAAHTGEIDKNNPVD